MRDDTEASDKKNHKLRDLNTEMGNIQQEQKKMKKTHGPPVRF